MIARTQRHIDRQRANNLPQPAVSYKIRPRRTTGICLRMVVPSNDLCERSFVRWRHHPKTDAPRAWAASTVRVLTISRLLQLSANVFQINNIVH